MHAITGATQTDLPLIKDGDAGLVIKSDGKIQVFNTFDLDNLTIEQAATHERLTALTVALRVPKIMGILMTMAEDPDVMSLLPA